jgi:hypothetical protein
MATKNFKVRQGLETPLIADDAGITAITLSGANAAIVGTLDVQGGTVTDSTGALSITTGASNGSITLDPNGTGNVVLTFANGGNLTNDRNYLLGAVRDTTTLNNGNIYTLQSTISPTRGVSLSNSDAPSSYRPGILMRSYSGGAVAPRSWIVSENARGTVASPTAIQNNDKFCEIMAQGYNGTNWSGDQVLGTPFLFRASATEAWAASPARAGTKLEVICQPAGVTYTASTPMNIIDHGPTSATYRADTWDFRTRTAAGGGTNISQLSLDVSGNAILAGDLRINGNDIQGSGGLSAVTLTNDNSSTIIRGDTTSIVSAAGKTFSNILETGGKVTSTLIQNRATSASEFATSSWNTYRSTDSINYTPTQNTDVLGEFKFNGNANTSTTPGVPGSPGGNVVVSATENWTSTANGTRINFLAIKQGTLDSYPVFTANPTGSEFRADSFTFSTAVASPVTLATIDSTAATFTVPVVTDITSTTISEGTTYTPAATVNSNLSIQINALAGGTTIIDLASLTGNNRGASYNMLVFNNTGSGAAIQVKNTRINSNNLMTHTITTGSPRIIINAYVVGDYATATHLVVA